MVVVIMLPVGAAMQLSLLGSNVLTKNKSINSFFKALLSSGF